ncbi:MAG: DUF4150 domain-containing protein [Opitutaceae bacterium]|nr:DUF4150 domain-containing protein [Opitutaceae bacterium]
MGASDHGVHKSKLVKIRNATPHVCWKQTSNGEVQVTYPCTAYVETADVTVGSVRFRGDDSLNMQCRIPKCTGAEPATRGVKSNQNPIGKCTPAQGVSTVNSESSQVITHDQKWDMAEANCVGMACHEQGSQTVLLAGPTTGSETTYMERLESKFGVDAIDLNENSSPDLRNANRVVLNEHGRWFTISNVPGVQWGTENLKVDQLASKLKASGFSGKEVQLVSCNSDKLAARLSELMPGVSVIGYDENVTVANPFLVSPYVASAKTFLRTPLAANELVFVDGKLVKGTPLSEQLQPVMGPDGQMYYTKGGVSPLA